MHDKSQQVNGLVSGWVVESYADVLQARIVLICTNITNMSLEVSLRWNLLSFHLFSQIYIFWLWLISVMPIKIFRSTHLLPCNSIHKKQTAFCISLLSRHSPLSKARSSSDPSLGTRKTSGKSAVTKWSCELTAHTPLKINMEHNHGCLEDRFPF